MNTRSVLVQLLGELLYVERRLADEVIADVAGSVTDPSLKASLEEHSEETAEHRERVEAAFRRLEIAPTSNRVPQFEQLVGHHDEVTSSIPTGPLQDVIHAQSAFEVEHWEIARYVTLLTFAPEEVAELLRPSLASEKHAAETLAKAIERLGRDLA